MLGGIWREPNVVHAQRVQKICILKPIFAKTKLLVSSRKLFSDT